jgi:hypothetical protein
MILIGSTSARKSIQPGKRMSGSTTRTALIAIGADTNLEAEDATTHGAFGNVPTRWLVPLDQLETKAVMPLANVGQLRASHDAFPKIWLMVRCDKLLPGLQSKIEPCIAVDHHDQCGGAARPEYALGSKDVALSRLKQGFDSPRERQ